MRQMDRQAMERIRTIIHEFEPDLNNSSHGGSKDRSSMLNTSAENFHSL